MGRSDGKKVKNIDNMYSIASFIMAKRSDACNSVTVRVPFKPMHEYILEARKRGYNISHMGLVLAAYVRAVSQNPAINRFVVNKRIYARNCLKVGMVVQRADGAEGTMSKMDFAPTDTVFDVNEKINTFVSNNRDENTNSTDALMSTLLKIPGLLTVAIGLFKWADKHGLLPKSILDASPFHCSMVISNLASIRTNHIYHHIYDFGTISQIITMGNMEDVAKLRDGKLVLERYLPLGIVCDERIASGYYYGRCFHEMRKYLADPHLLETPPDKVVVDF